jgi:hypothetical protein
MMKIAHHNIKVWANDNHWIFSWKDLLWKVSVWGSGGSHGQSNVIGFYVIASYGLEGYVRKF